MREIKEDFLRLLKEDEEFRYAVVGYLGIEDIRSGQARLEEAVARLEEAVARLEEVVAKLAEDLRVLAQEQRRTARVLRQVTTYVERVSLTLEEEATSMTEYRLRQKGINIKLSRLLKPYLEMDIYGTADDLTVIGEAKTRLAARHIRILERKIGKIVEREPNLIKGKLIKTIYAMWAHPEALTEAEEKEIWVTTPTQELTSFPAT